MCDSFHDRHIIDEKDKIFSITELGEEVLNKIENSYKEKLVLLSDVIMESIKKLSDTKINDEICRKNNIILRKGWDS